MVKKKEVVTEEKMFTDDLDELPGLGTVRINRMKAAGIEKISHLAIISAIDLHNETSIELEDCRKFVIAARDYLNENQVFDRQITSSDELLRNELKIKRFSTGDTDIDEKLLGGGIESGAITEFYGAFGSGKSQICFSTAVIAASQGKNVLWIDTEHTYSPKRIHEIAARKGFNPFDIQKRIVVMQPNNSDILTLNIKSYLHRYIEKYHIELLIIDSIIALHRSEYIGRGKLAERQQMLNNIVSRILKNAIHYNIAVIFTNQVSESPEMFKGQAATGGNVIAHSSTHRIYLKTMGTLDKQRTVATMIDSPRYPKSQVLFTLQPSGIKYKNPSEGDSKEEKEKHVDIQYEEIEQQPSIIAET